MSAHGKRVKTRLVPLTLAAAVVTAGAFALGVLLLPRNNYDVRRDYAYTFGGASTVPLTLRPDGMEAAGPPLEADALLVPIRVEASLTGRWLTPAIDIVVDGRTVASQSFEVGACGLRYLDASFAVPALRASSAIQLRGRRVSWSPGRVEALAFRNAPPSADTVLVIAPHPDDAEIAAFGLYRTTPSYVVTLTSGDGGWPRYGHLVPDPRRQAAIKGFIRFWDSLTIPALGGVTPARVLNLAYPDTRFRKMFEAPDTEVANVAGEDMNVLRARNTATLARELAPARATWRHLVADLERILATLQPGTIVAPHPFLDSDSDHALATEAVFEALERSAPWEFSLLLYTNHAVGAEHFPFGRRGDLVGLPPWFDSTTPFHGLMSRPLDDESRMLKLFALEAMHDLRHGPSPADSGLLRDLRGAAAVLKNGLADRLGVSRNYLRRAARPNELFFVYRPGDVPRLREAYRARNASPPSR